ncbi:MAG: DUF5675 family protein [Abyssibacter sp.]|uniref:DUF5675 family protein n=1 Tax=Abyssibacter sp. TaxID=2320200 RepID=UPI003219DFE6
MSGRLLRCELVRFAYTPHGVFGRLVLPDFECFTVERPWEGNAPRVSCIPEGIYALEPSRFHRGGYDCYEVVGVPGRSMIKVHRGNTMHDLLGCIAPGQGLGYVRGCWAVTRSKVAFESFMAAMAGQSGQLIVKPYLPEYP